MLLSLVQGMSAHLHMKSRHTFAQIPTAALQHTVLDVVDATRHATLKLTVCGSQSLRFATSMVHKM